MVPSCVFWLGQLELAVLRVQRQLASVRLLRLLDASVCVLKDFEKYERKTGLTEWLNRNRFSGGPGVLAGLGLSSNYGS